MSDRVIPTQWMKTDLDNVLLSIVGGGTPSKANPSYYQGDIPWMSVKDMNKNVLEDTVDHISQEAVENSSTNVIPAGVPIIATRMSLGKIVVANFDTAINQDLKALFLPKQIDRNYLIWWYRSIAKDIENLGTGTTVKGVRLEVLRELQFPMAPLAEQKIIADKLDTLLAQVESIKARLERIPEILKQFRQSVLTAAVSGKLFNQDEKYKSITVEDTWFHVVEGRKHWQQYKFSEVVKIVGGSQPPKAEFRYEPMEGYIRLIQIRDYKSDDHKVFIPRKLAKRFVTKDDVMIGRYGPPIFQILRGLEGAYNVALMKAEPNKDLIDREYLFWFLQNSQIYNYIEAGSDRTAGQSGVNKKHLESYPIFLPPLSEQIEIVAKVKNLFACSDMIEQQVQSALDRVNNLTQSILAKAFRGELTAEWREANPELISGENNAEALLKRIKAERESAKPTTKRGRAKT